jgi:sulfhydrogenase subunit alpha
LSENKNISINVPILARVEGEGALELTIRNNNIESLKLKIYEPPRLFEKFLESRSYTEVLDFVARICGICPVAYQMSAVHAIESIFNINPGTWVRDMRRVFYCGEWLESHSMHIHFLAAPDFFGYSSAMEMAKDYPEEIRRGLRLQSVGNALIKLFGQRSVHPVGARVGGFFQAPSKNDVEEILKKLKIGVSDAEELIRWTASLPTLGNSHEFTCVSLKHPNEYPMNEGNIVSDAGLNISIDEFENYFKEFQVPYSNALHCTLQKKSYLVGPLARVNNNYDRLPSKIQQLIDQVGIKFPSKKMHHSIVARAIEIYYGVLEAIRVLQNYTPLGFSKIAINPQAGIGFGCTEAPRGMLWQRYEIDKQGIIKSAQIVPPTSQNQARIEEDLRISLEQYGLNKEEKELRLYSEKLIRNYDPCISCSTHFLDLRINRYE